MKDMMTFQISVFAIFSISKNQPRSKETKKSADYVGLPNQKQSACKMVNNQVE